MYDFCISPLYATALLVGGLCTQTIESAGEDEWVRRVRREREVDQQRGRT